MKLRFGQQLPMLFQSEIAECGLACLAMVSCYHGKRVTVRELRQRFQLSGAGASVKQMMLAADRLTLRCRALKLELRDLERLALPAILHWDLDHFVVLRKLTRRCALIHDPAVGIRRYTLDEMDCHVTGIALELAPATGFVETAGSPSLRLRQLLRVHGNFKGAILQLFVFSLLIQLLTLLTPLYLQLVIDQGVGRGDMDLVFLIALLFIVLTGVRHLTSYCRGLALLHFSNRLGMHLVGDAFHHLLRLPLGFFQRRELGDIVSRFSSLESIKQLVAHEMISVVVDGLFSLITVLLLFLYSPLLACLSIGFLLLFSVVRLSTLGTERNLRQEALVCNAGQQGRFLENIKSIAVTKVNGIEEERESDWQDSYVDSINADYRLGRLQLRLATTQGLIFGLDHIATIYFGAQLVTGGVLTVGQLMSFIFLKQHFTGSVNAMLPKLVEFRLMGLELERVADIVLAQPEPIDDGSFLARELRGGIEARALCFRYGGGPLLIDHQTWQIAAGELVALSGQSGCGKSTLLKLLLQIEKPQGGQVLFDGIDASKIPLRAFRDQVAAALHDDCLLAGDIAYNVHLGVDVGNTQRLQRACEFAGILDTISHLPLGFSTRIGDLGNLLSAGQAQRLLLARALFRQPRILIMDESLSHLGDDAALQLLAQLRRLRITLLMVTHNPALLAAADRRIHLPGRWRQGAM